MVNLPQNIDATVTLLSEQNYVCSRDLATVLYLCLSLDKPLFLEGEAGVGKTELAKDILTRSSIFVEYPEQTRIEGEIQQLDSAHPVTELWQVLSGDADGRKTDRQITLFDSVGFAIEDFSALRYIKSAIRDTGFSIQLDMLADPNDPRDLFSMLQRSA